MRDVIVIGCGIVGATISLALRRRGLDVLTLDDGRPMAGTPASGGHLKPSWFKGMSKTDYEPAMALLDEVWGLKQEEFTVRPLGIPASVYRVDTDLVTATLRTVAKVTRLEHLDNCPEVIWDGGEERARCLILAAGVWVGELLGEALAPDVVAKQGVSFRLKHRLDRPFIRPWAPYKQVVAHQQGPEEVWVGDGSALLTRSWTPDRTETCASRCLAAVGVPRKRIIRTVHGLRPYCAPEATGEPCLLRKVGPQAWVATGAGKLGTIAAGWAAGRVLRELLG